MSSITRLLGLFAPTVCLLGPVAAATITLDTATAAWTVSGGGATNATPFPDGSGISITSNTLQSGTFVTGGSAANFDGFWTASLQFFLPSNATNVALNFVNLANDDRGVLELNGTIIGSEGIFGPGAGQMTLVDGGPNNAFTFGIGSGSANSGFILGGTNTLLAILNDTGTGISGPLNTSHVFQTGFGVTGTVTYNVPTGVPEPSSNALLLVGGSALLLVRRWHIGIGRSAHK